MSEGDHHVTNNTTKFLYAFTKNILNFNKSIKWIGITDQDR